MTSSVSTEQWHQQYLELQKTVERLQAEMNNTRAQYARRIQNVEELWQQTRPQQRTTASQNVPEMQNQRTQTDFPIKETRVPPSIVTKDAASQTEPSKILTKDAASHKEPSSARLLQKTIIDAFQLNGFPAWAILPIFEVEKLCKREDVHAAVWCAWWNRIACGINALKEGDTWDKKWTYPIMRFAERAARYQPRRSQQIEDIMEAFWRGDEGLSYPRAGVESIFKEFPSIAAAFWFQDSSKAPFAIYPELCANILDYLPLMVYGSYELSTAGYTLDLLIKRSIQAKNLQEALKCLHIISKVTPLVSDRILAAVNKSPRALAVWIDIVALEQRVRAQKEEQVKEMMQGILSQEGSQKVVFEKNP